MCDSKLLLDENEIEDLTNDDLNVICARDNKLRDINIYKYT